MKPLHRIRKRQLEIAQYPATDAEEAETIEVQMDADMLADLREVASQLGFRNIQALIKAYASEGLSRDKELIHKQQAEG